MYDFFSPPCHLLLSHRYNFIDSGSDCVLWSYTGVKDNWSRGCLFHGNGVGGGGGGVEPCARAILYTAQKGQDPAIGPGIRDPQYSLTQTDVFYAA